jgi:hypothetical protein
MKEFFKKQSAAVYLLFAVIFLGLVAFIIALANNGDSGYFHGDTSVLVILMTVLALLCEIGTVVLLQFHFDGLIGRILEIAESVLMIVAAALFIVSVMNFISPRVEGFAYIFGADSNTKAEIQTADNMRSAAGSIVGIIFYFLAGILATVASFFPLVKAVKNQPAPAATK